MTATGIVRDAAGDGVVGLRAQLQTNAGERALAVTGADGSFRALLPACPRPISVELDSDRWVLDPASLQAKDPLAPIVLRAEQACRVHGRVVEPDGTPVAFAAVLLAAPHAGVSGLSPRGRWTVADARGEFAFERLTAAAVDLVLIARHVRVGAICTEVSLPRPGTTLDLVVRATPAGEVRGVLQDAAGRPLVNAALRLPRLVPGRVPGMPFQACPFVDAYADPDGRFRVRGLPEERYELYVTPFVPQRAGGPRGRRGGGRRHDSFALTEPTDPRALPAPAEPHRNRGEWARPGPRSTAPPR